jgi:hypothetical protein
MNVIEQRKEIAEWISGLENHEILNAIYSIKENSTLSFKEKFEKGISSDELKEKTTEFLKSLPWKKLK